ncbi:lantibiotic dehydratase [Priestia aryabhattai]|uniref:lantibiotic dehydratase n=1 Tax=Priestia aryabhattai TaxID=412384 RepID=UPI0027E3F229|nr:lantibiotic dehydratase [Priestia aryabhattai]WJX02680.1 lantibiotic dehydratase [Priestia aryabhattai]
MKTYYVPTKKYMQRIPLQPNSLLDRYNNIEENIDNIIKDKYFCEQLLIASEPIYNTLTQKEFTVLSKKKRRNMLTSLGNYINRAATRTTPFGLFSGVSIVNTSSQIDSKNIPQTLPYKKHSRIDSEWIFKFIKNTEKNYFDILNFKMNTAIYQKGNRLYLPYILEGSSEEINVNFSNALKIVCDMCNKNQVSFNEIVNKLKEVYPHKNIHDLASYLEVLIEKDFLISELRPPICNTDLLEYIINKFEEIPFLHEKYNHLLYEIKSLINDFNNTLIGEGIDIYSSIKANIDKLFSYPNQKYLQVDTEITFNENYLDDNDFKNINECITLLLKFASDIKSSHTSDQTFEDYQLKFVEKFGSNVEVPLHVVIDEIDGIGAPITYQKPKNKFSQELLIRKNSDESLLKRFFMDKYLAAIENKQPIILKNEEIERLDLEIDEEKLPTSLELNFIIRKTKENENLLFLGPNIGSYEAGKTFGRFSYMSSSFTNFLEEIDKELKDDKIANTELSFIPSHMRSANVMRVNSPKQYNISMYTNTHESSNEISLSDILVGFNNKQFYLKNKHTGELLNISGSHMLNLSSTSNIIRLLNDITLSQQLDWMTMPWEVFYKDLVHIPEIQYKNLTLSNEKWSLMNLRASLKTKVNFEEFMSRFERFKKDYSVPNKVYLQFADNRVLLDLLQTSDLKLLFKNFFKYPAVTLEKAEQGLPRVEIGGELFSSEVVIPYLLEKKYREKDKDNYFKGSLHNELRHEPFTEWLYMKVYGVENRQDELIGYLKYFIFNHVNEKDYKMFFYMRYNDPKPHIRLRFKADDPNKLVYIYFKLKEYIEDLQRMGLVYETTINTYFPEVNRYGGPQLIEYAENLFYKDSLVTMELIELMQTLGLTKEETGVISLIHYLKAFGLTFENQLVFLEINLKNDLVHKKLFKDDQFDYISILDSYNDWEELKKNRSYRKVIEVLNTRNTEISSYLNQIKQSEQINNDFWNIIGSVIHLHFNRLFNINRDFEDKLYSYAYHTLYGQRVLRNIRKPINA